MRTGACDRLPDDVLELVLRAAGPCPSMGVCRRWYAAVHDARPPIVDLGALILARGERWLARRVRACDCVATGAVLVVLLCAAAQPAMFLYGLPGFGALVALHALAFLAFRDTSRTVVLVAAATAIAVVAAAGSAWGRSHQGHVQSIGTRVALTVPAVVRMLAVGALAVRGSSVSIAMYVEGLLMCADVRVPMGVLWCSAFTGILAATNRPGTGSPAPPDAARRLSVLLVRATVTRRSLLRGIAVPETLGLALVQDGNSNTPPSSSCTPSRSPSRCRAGRFRSQEDWMAAWIAVRALEHRVRSVLRSA